jgi:hypothetical protein
MRVDSGAGVATAAALISQLLNCGFCYVTSEAGKLMALLSNERSMLVLRPDTIDPQVLRVALGVGDKALEKTVAVTHKGFKLDLPLAVHKRAKDMARIFRNKVKKRLQLRLNSDFDQALRKLRAHHGAECWIGAPLEAVWRLMLQTSPPQLLIFELWYGDELVAADFAHPVGGGGSVYVATRFFDRSSDEVKFLQAGFVLSLSATAILLQAGCSVWDLGGISLNPLMQYKRDLAGVPFDRPTAHGVLTSINNSPANPSPANPSPTNPSPTNHSPANGGPSNGSEAGAALLSAEEANAASTAAAVTPAAKKPFCLGLSSGVLVQDMQLSDILGHG